MERRRDWYEVARVGTRGLTVIAVELRVVTVCAGLAHLDTVRVVEAVAGGAGQGGEA